MRSGNDGVRPRDSKDRRDDRESDDGGDGSEMVKTI